MEPRRYSLEPRQEHLVIDDRGYIIMQATAAARANYRNAVARSMKFNEDGKPIGVENMADTEFLLVSQCLYYTDDQNRLIRDKQGNPDPKSRVPVVNLQTWPGDVFEEIFNLVKQVSRIDMEESEESLEKNIQEMQEKLNKLRKARSNGEPEGEAKNSPGSTTGN